MIATDIKQMIIATEGHGVTRTTSVNIRDAPMQKQQTNYCHSNRHQQMIIATEWHGITRIFH